MGELSERLIDTKNFLSKVYLTPVIPSLVIGMFADAINRGYGNYYNHPNTATVVAFGAYVAGVVTLSFREFWRESK